MKTITTTAHIASDGSLRLELPTGLAPGSAEVVVVVQPDPLSQSSGPQSLVSPTAAPAQPWTDVAPEVIEARRRALQEYIDKALERKAAAGSEPVPPADAPSEEGDLGAPSPTCSGLFLGRLPEDHDIDAAIDEMNAQWKAKLEDLKLEP
jgi:hypothetical protein